MTVLLAAHVGLALWGAAANSVTFDENFHVPAGVVEVGRGDFWARPRAPRRPTGSTDRYGGAGSSIASKGGGPGWPNREKWLDPGIVAE